MKSNKTEQTVNPRIAWANNRINILDKRLGAGLGATRERFRLNKISKGGGK